VRIDELLLDPAVVFALVPRVPPLVTETHHGLGRLLRGRRSASG
jgi:hypothetical protein